MATRANLGTLQPQAVTTSTTLSLSTPAVETIVVGINITALSGTSPTVLPSLQVLGYDNVWYTVWQPSAAYSTTGQRLAVITPASSATVITGSSAPAAWTNQAQLVLTVAGTTPSITMSASVWGN